MMNPFADVSWRPTLGEKRRFAQSLLIGFPIVAAVFSLVWWFARHAWNPFFVWLAAIGFLAGVVLWLLPAIARPFYVLWYFVACCVGFVVGNFLLLAFYYLVLTPLGLALRGWGRLSFRKGPDRSVSSYWRDAEKTVDLQRYYRQF